MGDRMEAAEPYLKVNFQVPIPPVKSARDLPQPFQEHGHFAILADGTLLFGSYNMEFPSGCREYRWAVSSDTLFLWPVDRSRGWDRPITDKIIRRLARKTGKSLLYRKFKEFRPKD